MRWRGGGHKRRYRIIDFKRRKDDAPAKVERLEYDPNRTAFIALITLPRRRIILHPRAPALARRRHRRFGERVDVKPGNSMPLRNIPLGTIVHNVEMKPGKGGQIARSAGTYVQLVGRDRATPCCACLGRNPDGARRMPWRRSARCRTRITRTS